MIAWFHTFPSFVDHFIRPIAVQVAPVGSVDPESGPHLPKLRSADIYYGNALPPIIVAEQPRALGFVAPALDDLECPRQWHCGHFGAAEI